MNLICVDKITAQKAQIINLESKEIGLLIDVDKDSDFKNYYVFQYNQLIEFDFIKNSNLEIFSIAESIIKLKFENFALVFTIEKHYKGLKDEIVFYGYGLSKRTGNFSIDSTKNIEQAISINELILVNGRIFIKGKPTCHSGGIGSSSCSVTPSNMSLGTPSCSVSCSTGFHSCCDDTKGECTCIADKVKTVN